MGTPSFSHHPRARVHPNPMTPCEGGMGTPHSHNPPRAHVHPNSTSPTKTKSTLISKLHNGTTEG
jgi:hypothetical protein